MENRTAVATLIIAQIVCAINWFSVSSVFSQIAADFHQNVSGLGLITSTFVLGVALFQLPAGLISARYGPKRALSIGLLLISVSSILIGLIDDILSLTVLRFVEGVGEAFIFGPGVILITRYFKKGSEGLGIGLFGGAFDLGGIAGISGWTILGAVAGWRLSVISGGVIGFASWALLLFFIPDDPEVGALSIRLSELRGIVFNKWLLIVSSGLVVSQVAFGLNSYFMVYYLEESLNTGTALAGAIPGLTLVLSVVISPLVGRAYDKSPSPKLVYIALCLAASAGVAIAAFSSLYGALLSGVVIGGATAGAFVFGVGIARAIGGARPEYGALGISWINGIALFGGVVMPLVFSAIAAGYGYTLAWGIGGVILVGITLPIFALRSEAGT